MSHTNPSWEEAEVSGEKRHFHVGVQTEFILIQVTSQFQLRSSLEAAAGSGPERVKEAHACSEEQWILFHLGSEPSDSASVSLGFRKTKKFGVFLCRRFAEALC